MRKKKLEIKKGGFDKILVSLTAILLIVGTIAIADTSSAQAMRTFADPYYFLKQHLFWLVVGVVGLVISATVQIDYWKRVSSPFFVFAMFLLILVLIPGIGSKVYGARRWINMFGFGFQPSEVMKLGLSLFIAKLTLKNYSYLHYIGAIGLVIMLIMLQPDLGTSLVLVGIGTAQLFVAGFSILYFIVFAGVSATLGSLFILFSDYRRERMVSFLKIANNPLESSYHIKQILIALGSGGLLGVGIGQSRQKHLFLPETATDSVFAIIAEEVGFLGSVIIITLLTAFVLNCFKIALRTDDEYAKSLATGISSWFALQIFLNLSSMVVLTPLTGIPLPFFSYGGTSLIMILVATGIILQISKYEQK